MNLTIDWGTLIVSVPVVAATCFGAIKFIGKAYLKQHFDQRLESFKTELLKDTEKYKSELEKEKNVHIKDLEFQAARSMKMFDMSSKDKYQAFITMWEQVRVFFNLYNSNRENPEECRIEAERIKESKKSISIHISEELAELFDSLYDISYNAIGAKRHYYRLRNADPNNATMDRAQENFESYLERVTTIYNNIEKLLRDELKGSL
ncbi:hypothetical protein G7L40_20670 [Paenibacillus polymyxa]|uniref:Uncharacterized protein n=1 Tax=Paenibacillus polymyxa TaxID=1406 RepID=A0A378Y0W1_PAEPO|nr:hypothetical protein [Paenibacillus polymyxa]MBE7896092.1 hypothetical protein [Paenibacillus polymyxa]MBG9765960.1 hypothetical protein [Paenibacillus polymyxa]MCC3256626.1 hypothetical protein [Paenibacillus polymyxa]QPK54886.1 hypothetical protein G7035_20725 [Paenibacillus polymyxa]QPK59974.1 hypothetical protein G7L40_20670 [Paenibacillus polymyxa]